ncbi:hypothetical protein [Priestia megaterium]|uniref:hypothetical protein n=1 Tax=Priestia megaterium TaxID=1404 RepID=UPI002E1FD4D7|nr:hypothetical protein [Priestia megaterium]
MIRTGSLKDINRIVKVILDQRHYEGDRAKCRKYVKKNHLISDDIYNLNYVDVTIDVWLKKGLMK